jgi:membrane-bound lytic murein transglycosylase B
MTHTLLRFALALICLSLATPAASAFSDKDPQVRAFVDDMVDNYGFDRRELVLLLKKAKKQQSILDAISRPAEKTKPWHEYRQIFLTDKRIESGTRFWKEHEAELLQVSSQTGVPPEIIVGIIGVETFYGRITGKYRVIDALATLAFEYPPRSAFFSKELREFLLLAREERMDATDATGSYAGAMGMPQFMPSSYRAYAVDSSADGKRDIWNNWSDVFGSVANYFVAHGWTAGAPVVAQATLGDAWSGEPPANQLKASETIGSLSAQGVLFATELGMDEKGQLLTYEVADGNEYWVGFDNFFVITRYNRSVMYALAVHQLGQAIGAQVRSE